MSPRPIADAPSTVPRRLSSDHLRAIFESPDLYPLKIDFQKRVVLFVRMSEGTYRNSVFLDGRTRHLGTETYEIRLDDMLLSQASIPSIAKRVHYILHPTFSCSTLLARYFELIPTCFVLKEPMLLSQIALVPPGSVLDWDDLFRMSIRLLTRTYRPGDVPIIKAHEPCNPLANQLLESNGGATITFLMIPLRQFVLAVLKLDSRRKWVRTRIPAAAIAARCDALMHIKPEDLSDGQAAAYLWLVNMFVLRQLRSGKHSRRVHWVNGDKLADMPDATLKIIMAKCGVSVDKSRLQMMIEDPLVGRYSKDLSRPFGPGQRHAEMTTLERCFGSDADDAIKWAASQELQCDLPKDR